MKRFRRLKRHWGLPAILAIYLALAVFHSLVAPLTTGNDEWAHFLYTRFIAEQGLAGHPRQVSSGTGLN